MTTYSACGGSTAQVWSSSVIAVLILLTSAITVGQGAWQLGEEPPSNGDFNELGSFQSVVNVETERRWFLAPRRSPQSSSSSSTSETVADLRSLIGASSARHNASVRSRSSAAAGPPRPVADEPDRRRSTAVRRLPRAIIVGVKKGGTRALLEYLKIHPDVRAAGHEVHFFDRHYHKGLDWYRSQMPATLPDQLTVEKTPSYFVTRGVAERVKNMSRRHRKSRDFRLLVVVRDPVTRALSDYAQSASKRPHVADFRSLALVEANGSTAVNADWGPVRLGLYALYVGPWLDRFAAHRLRFVRGDRLISDPAGEMAAVESFLGLRPFITDRNFYFNATKGFPCVRSSTGEGWKSHCLGRTKGRRHPSVEPEVLERLRRFYRPYNYLFYKMTGIDFGWD